MTDEKQKLEFDADFSANAEINRKAAQAHKLRFSESRQCYVDEDGCLIRDKFGQQL